MASLNVVCISGRLTRDPELTELKSGTKVCKMRIAVNDRVKRGDEWVDKAHFFDVTTWENVADVCNRYLSKGSLVTLSGKLVYEEWKAEDGTNRSAVKINAREVQLPPKSENGGGGGRDEQRPPAADEDDIPF